MSLREYSTMYLRRELLKREKNWQEGVCDYCGGFLDDCEPCAQEDRHMTPFRICCMSDFHGILPAVPKADLYIMAGDWFNGPDPYWGRMIEKWAESLPAPLIGIAGNHDYPLRDQLYKPTTWTYLQDSGTEFNGYNVWGTPWSKLFCNWAFMLPESELGQRWALIPDDTDILIVHGPPYGCADRGLGSESLRQRILEIQPKLVICGHIHDQNGVYYLGDTKVVSASLMTEQYKPTQPLQMVWFPE